MKRADTGRPHKKVGDGHGYERIHDGIAEMSDDEFWGRADAYTRGRAETTRNQPTSGVRSGTLHIPKR